ncbi:DNA primase catalytic subunit PriS [Archaeoglobus veneficus]|uniref:DNA primase small subunit PriS n=1 Tax=Archaeoglobus veneficus (strain DSM 11195 / SNP6) TaxID=693661 RepID=F2KRN9_ARCVS|nr:DNA primase catalytic subunit PriS [Archaeoglobus veneficus]AEA47903.1 DNA primase small subunit [Archaeoglobus veneficus SNP6]
MSAEKIAMERTKIYLTRKFSEYYARATLKLPREFKRREWAFVPLDALPAFVMHRHIAFESEEQLKTYILNTIPAHIYYSSAYYLQPDAEKMEDKGWMKADLIFDIDADHLPIKVKSMEAALKVAKKEIIRLVKILEEDFGIDEKDMKIVFSGGRGYHLHVYSDEFTGLGSAERREIVDYLLLNQPARCTSTQWLRIARCVAKRLAIEVKKGNLPKYGISGKQLERFQAAFNRETLERIAEGDFSVFKGKRAERMLETFVEECINRLAVHVDAPVTADTRRLIRFPGSLHGKTGLKVTPVSIDDIEDFDPLVDALAFGDEKVKIRSLTKVRLKMAGEEIKLAAGEKAVVPEYAAVFLLCRGMALYGH